MFYSETKEEVLERILALKKPKCKYCDKEMKVWETPLMPVGDGLGWGTPYLFICFNDECSLYKKGWEHINETYAHNASYRCINYPGTEQYECVPVFSSAGGQGQIIDEQTLAQEEALKENIKKGFLILAGCYQEKNWLETLRILVDAAQPARVRLKAAEMLGDIGDIEVIDTMKSCKFGNKSIQTQVNDSITAIHERHFTKECPFCAEIIKKRAQMCKHCGESVV
ncbi:MAG: zinc ribbon domain-containing protein [Deltaproteobacteria bacterium]|nr:zinc ribbon domain-containing protein [Deltaproteobacteria bacterium]